MVLQENQRQFNQTNVLDSNIPKFRQTEIDKKYSALKSTSTKINRYQINCLSQGSTHQNRRTAPHQKKFKISEPKLHFKISGFRVEIRWTPLSA